MSERYMILEGGRRQGKSVSLLLANNPKIAEYLLTKYGSKPTIKQIQEAINKFKDLKGETK